MGVFAMIKFEINWNRKLALRGEGTAVAVHDAISAFVHGNFATINHGKYMRGKIPSLGELLAMQPGTDSAMSGAYDDGTGRAAWAVWVEA
jgi:hypothetical protein